MTTRMVIIWRRSTGARQRVGTGSWSARTRRPANALSASGSTCGLTVTRPNRSRAPWKRSPASRCTVLSGGDAELRVTTTHGERRGPGSGTGARAAVLDLLATASVHRELPSVRLFGGRAEITILVSPTEEAALELLAFETTPVLRSVVAVLTNETPPNGEPNVALRHFAARARPVVMVRAGHGLEAAWAEAFGRVSRGTAFVTREPATMRMHRLSPR